jgi:hypothetical protein
MGKMVIKKIHRYIQKRSKNFFWQMFKIFSQDTILSQFSRILWDYDFTLKVETAMLTFVPEEGSTANRKLKNTEIT